MWPNESLPSWRGIQTTQDWSLGAWQAAKGAEEEAEALDPEHPLYRRHQQATEPPAPRPEVRAVLTEKATRQFRGVCSWVRERLEPGHRREALSPPDHKHAFPTLRTVISSLLLDYETAEMQQRTRCFKNPRGISHIT